MELSEVKCPDDLRALTYEECENLADDIRTRIIQVVSQNGGHLSSNLGIVEITLALHRVFHAPEDKIVFDVGHQTYAHKLITGRYEAFSTLRTYGGISGFPRRCESEFDCFEAGHASTAISAAVGLARARDALGQKHHVVAVVGDGALTGGMCYEALNDCGSRKTRLIIILNDNEMSIAPNVGALSRHLSNLRASSGWNVTKNRVKRRVTQLPVLGKPIYTVMHTVKQMIKSVFVDEGFFSALGFRYLGPIDGNNQEAVEKILLRAESLDEPVVIHCITKKGYGYNRAEKKPDLFHGIPPFFLDDQKAPVSSGKSNGETVTEELCKLAEKDERIQAITAAMELGTGTIAFKNTYPNRYFDVGISEEHAVTMCAGMASGGLRPFFFVYSTFLQRAYDQMLHDVCIQNLPVVLMIDRAGLSNSDGQSHQGLFDLAFLRQIPRMTILAPANEKELRLAVEAAYRLNAPCSVRYPKDTLHLPSGYSIDDFQIGRWQVLRPGQDAALLTVGSMTAAGLRVADALADNGIQVQVVNCSTVKPLDEERLTKLFEAQIPIVTVEEHVLAGGFGSAVLEYAAKCNQTVSITPLAVGDFFVQHGDRAHLLRDVALDDESIASAIIKLKEAVADVG
ncbi:MAG: 1-deoxy-D-xylulose-5-phosphate synthase [Eubacteriales bacterium]|nr:1-deoxy-D-xylulose-5-phosphate synthase [Eubacteriales bacterium]